MGDKRWNRDDTKTGEDQKKRQAVVRWSASLSTSSSSAVDIECLSLSLISQPCLCLSLLFPPLLTCSRRPEPLLAMAWKEKMRKNQRASLERARESRELTIDVEVYSFASLLSALFRSIEAARRLAETRRAIARLYLFLSLVSGRASEKESAEERRRVEQERREIFHQSRRRSHSSIIFQLVSQRLRREKDQSIFY